jgi:LPXTG-motif cell wall-anchored protein
MQLDVRIPMGWLFLTLGVILIVFGFTSDPAIYATHSLGQNVNLVWGGVFAVFGALVLLIARKKKS